MAVNKVTWQQVGHVTEPGSYMFRFGRLSIGPADLAIWNRFPNASFTLVQTLSVAVVSETGAEDVPMMDIEQYHLGAFELHVGSKKPAEDSLALVPDVSVEPPVPLEIQSQAQA